MNTGSIKKLQNQSGPILVTGHTGFKGAWLILLLQQLGVEVIGYSLPPIPGSLYEKLNISGTFPEEYGDILDVSKFEKFIEENNPSSIIHLAAQSLVPHSYVEPKNTFEVNVVGTINVLQASMKYPTIKSVLCVTSDKVYLNMGESRPFVETSPLGGVDPYSASKAASEIAISAWVHMSKTKNGPLIMSARSGNVIGGGDTSKDRLIPDIIRAVRNNENVVVRNPSFTRPWQHVLDTLLGYLVLLSESNFNTVHNHFNFGPNASSLTVQQICDLVKNHWRDRISFTIDGGSQFYESKYLELDCNLARAKLNWEPLLSQEEALFNTLEWWDKVFLLPGSEKDNCISDINKFLDMSLNHTKG